MIPRARCRHLLFTVFQTVFTALYDDRLSVEFEGKEEGDTDTAENLTDLAEHDYRVMQKDEADYEWIWDAWFFSRGLQLLNDNRFVHGTAFDDDAVHLEKHKDAAPTPATILAFPQGTFQEDGQTTVQTLHRVA